MTFGSQRLRSVEQLESLVALSNDVGPTDFLEVFAVKGRTVGAASVVAGATGDAGNAKKPSFNPTGTLLAYPQWADSNFYGGSSIYQRSGANTWNYLTDLGEPGSGPRATGFSYTGTYLAVQQGDEVGLYTVPQYIDSWISPDTWADFNNDQWGSSDTWTNAQDWDNFVNDTWSVNNDFALFQTLSYGTGTGVFNDVAWSALNGNDVFLAVGHGSSPYFTVYQNSFASVSPFSAISNPSVLPTSGVNALCWDPSSSYLAVGQGAGAGRVPIFVYKRSDNPSTLTKLTTIASTPTVSVTACRFDPSGSYLAIGLISADATYENTDTPLPTANYFWVYKRSGDTFTKLADPAIRTTDRCFDLAWTADGTRLIVSTDNANTFMYRRSGDTLIFEHSFGDSVGCAVYPKSKSQR